MIGLLPKKLRINNTFYNIRSDFRVAISVLDLFNNNKISDNDKFLYCLKCIYKDFDKLSMTEYEEAFNKAIWFLDGGDMPKTKISEVKTFDWKYDETLLFPAINQAAGYEVREQAYLHWWTFLGYYMSIGESIFSTVLNIRKKRANGKPLEKWEREFYKNNKSLVNILTEEDKADIAETEAYIESLLKGDDMND